MSLQDRAGENLVKSGFQMQTLQVDSEPGGRMARWSEGTGAAQSRTWRNGKSSYVHVLPSVCRKHPSLAVGSS